MRAADKDLMCESRDHDASSRSDGSTIAVGLNPRYGQPTSRTAERRDRVPTSVQRATPPIAASLRDAEFLSTSRGLKPTPTIENRYAAKRASRPRAEAPWQLTVPGAEASSWDSNLRPK